MRTLTRWRAALIAVAISWVGVATAMTPQEILRRADEARGNLDGITWKVTVVSRKQDAMETVTFDVSARGFDIRAEYLAPPKYRGNKILMVNGNMWFHRPDLSKPVAVSQRQRLLGGAAYGDIAATNYAADYEATLIGEERVNEENCYVFELEARDKKTTYDHIKYWISIDRLVGVKAEYSTVSGKKFKSAIMRYENQARVNGKFRPFLSRITIFDGLMSKDTTILDLKNPVLQDLPDYLFNLNLLRR